MYSPNTKDQQRKRHVNSQRVNQLQQEIDEMERELRRRDIAITYPKVQQESVPMLGHTKGNTKNNRKRIKQQQTKTLVEIHAHLKSMLEQSGGMIPGKQRKGKRGQESEEMFDLSEEDSSSDDSFW